jgi:CHAD domain-containing protein
VAYSFVQHEPIGAAVKRIALEQLDGAIEDLVGDAEEQDEAVHDARQRLKRLRGLMRLLRSEVGESVFETENRTFRDAARVLAPARDAAAVIESFDNLLDRFELEVSREAFDELRRALVVAHGDTMLQAIDGGTLTRVDQILRIARERVQAWPISRNGFRALSGGLNDTYRRSRRGLTRVMRDPTVEHYHRWRRFTKYHLHHVRLLENIWRLELRSRKKALEELGDALGDLHDLDVLRAQLTSQHFPGNRMKVSALIALADRRLDELGREARALGTRIYAERPRALVRRFRVYFDAWRQESASAHQRALNRPPRSEAAPAASNGNGTSRRANVAGG